LAKISRPPLRRTAQGFESVGIRFRLLMHGRAELRPIARPDLVCRMAKLQGPDVPQALGLLRAGKLVGARVEKSKFQ